MLLKQLTNCEDHKKELLKSHQVLCLLGTSERPQEEDMNTKTDDAAINDEQIVDVDIGRSCCFLFLLTSEL